MKRVGGFAAITLIALAVVSCGGGPDPDEPVVIRVEASPQLNTYDEAPHPVDVYLYKLDDPTAFEATEIGKLLVEAQPVAGGFAIERRSAAPGSTSEWNIGSTRIERYTHIGVVTTFKEPKGPQRMIAEWEEMLELKLDAHGITSFMEYDD